MNGRGMALAQVLVMAMLLLLLAAGLMQMVFQNHYILVKSQQSDVNRAHAEACMAQLAAQWNGNPCGTTVFPASVVCTVGAVTVTARCTGGPLPTPVQVQYEVTNP